MSKVDLGKVAITVHGEWNPSAYYEKLSLVKRKGQSYISLRSTTGDDPESSRDDWMLFTERGESLYQMMVREGLFVGTEAQFLQQYQNKLAACDEAVSEIREDQQIYAYRMSEYAQSMAGYAAQEAIYAGHDADRNDAEARRASAEAARNAAETQRNLGESRREQSMAQIRSDAETALAMASEAQQKAEQAAANEQGRQSAEAIRQQNEQQRQQSEQQRASRFEEQEASFQQDHENNETQRQQAFVDNEAQRQNDFNDAEEARQELFEEGEETRNSATQFILDNAEVIAHKIDGDMTDVVITDVEGITLGDFAALKNRVDTLYASYNVIDVTYEDGTTEQFKWIKKP